MIILSKNKQKLIIKKVNDIQINYQINYDISQEFNIIDFITIQLNIKYKILPLESSNVLGLITTENNIKYIIINESIIKNGRFCIKYIVAQLLGNHFLHTYQQTHIVNNQTYLLDKGIPEEVLESRYFADNLLMPTNIIKDNIKPSIHIEDNIYLLANIFKIPIPIIAKRLNTLGYI
jgi:Zn-dependent peptidase ImmA (M78 family)